METNPIEVAWREQGERGYSTKCPSCDARISLFFADGSWGGEEASATECHSCGTTVKPVAVVVDEDGD